METFKSNLVVGISIWNYRPSNVCIKYFEMVPNQTALPNFNVRYISFFSLPYAGGTIPVFFNIYTVKPQHNTSKFLNDLLIPNIAYLRKYQHFE